MFMEYLSEMARITPSLEHATQGELIAVAAGMLLLIEGGIMLGEYISERRIQRRGGLSQYRRKGDAVDENGLPHEVNYPNGEINFNE